ncbi:MAG: hypothetical protein U0894_10200 [Pirellulales bacterium]
MKLNLVNTRQQSLLEFLDDEICDASYHRKVERLIRTAKPEKD